MKASGYFRRLPPLNAVRAFEAAARHVSFSKAAEELHVTRGAISRQVALLEEWLGRPLFLRTASQLVLTAAGRAYLTEATTALNRLAFASAWLDEQDAAAVIRLNAPPTFTMRWLITRMSTFQRRHPNIDLRVTTYRPTDVFREEEFDVGIRSRSGPLEGYVSVPFLAEWVVPICHPDLLGGAARLEPADLVNHTLITYRTDWYTWPGWLETVGHPDLKPRSVLRFDPMYFALQAAMEGLGIVLVPLFNVIDEVVAGRLCAPFGLLGQLPRHYYVSYPPMSHLAGAIAPFIEWLQKEGGETDRVAREWAAQLK